MRSCADTYGHTIRLWMFMHVYMNASVHACVLNYVYMIPSHPDMLQLPLPPPHHYHYYHELY